MHGETHIRVFHEAQQLHVERTQAVKRIGPHQEAVELQEVARLSANAGRTRIGGWSSKAVRLDKAPRGAIVLDMSNAARHVHGLMRRVADTVERPHGPRPGLSG